jgi:hypothetical protein
MDAGIGNRISLENSRQKEKPHRGDAGGASFHRGWITLALTPALSPRRGL